jgi:hypothetical protein
MVPAMSEVTGVFSDERTYNIDMGKAFTHILIGHSFGILAYAVMLDNEDAVTLANEILRLDMERNK